MYKTRNPLAQWNDRREFRGKGADAGRDLSHIFIGALALDDQFFIAQGEIVIIVAGQE